MNGVFLVIVIAILVAIAIIQIFLLLRKVPVDLNPVRQAIQSVEQSYERTERSVREEIAKNREETAKALRQSREELTGTIRRSLESAVGGQDGVDEIRGCSGQGAEKDPRGIGHHRTGADANAGNRA